MKEVVAENCAVLPINLEWRKSSFLGMEVKPGTSVPLYLAWLDPEERRRGVTKRRGGLGRLV